MKADEVRLYALRGGLKKQAVCYTHFHSNKVFRGDLNIFFCTIVVALNGQPDFFMKITLTELEFAEKKIDNIQYMFQYLL